MSDRQTPNDSENSTQRVSQLRRRLSERELSSAANDAVRRVSVKKRDVMGDLPVIPRAKKAEKPLDFGGADVPPVNQPFDPVESEAEIMGEADYEQLARAEQQAVTETVPQYNEPKTEPEQFDASEQDVLRAQYDVPQAQYTAPESNPVAEKKPQAVQRESRVPEPIEREPVQPVRTKLPPIGSDRDYLMKHNDKEQPMKKNDGKRRSQMDKKTRAIVISLLVIILANLLWVSIWLFSNYSLVGGQLIDREETKLDLSGCGIHSVLGLARLDKLTELDITDNDISINSYKYLKGKLPDCDIRWDIPLSADTSIPSDVSSADVSSSVGISESKLEKALTVAEQLERLDVSDCGLGSDRLLELEGQYGIDLIWDIELFGQKFQNDSKELSLAGMSGISLDLLTEQLRYFDRLEHVDLSDCGFSDTELYDFSVRNPQASISWKVKIGEGEYNTDSESLHIQNAGVSDLSALKYFYRLKDLRLDGNEITDISPIYDVTTLQVLYLANNKIANVSPLSSLSELRYLDLNGNDINDATPLSSLGKLEYLYLDRNHVTNMAQLSGMESLKELSLQRNGIEETAGFGNMPALTKLSLRYNDLDDPDKLSGLSGLSSLEMLDLQQNGLNNREQGDVQEALDSALPGCKVYLWK